MVSSLDILIILPLLMCHIKPLLGLCHCICLHKYLLCVWKNSPIQLPFHHILSLLPPTYICYLLNSLSQAFFMLFLLSFTTFTIPSKFFAYPSLYPVLVSVFFFSFCISSFFIILSKCPFVFLCVVILAFCNEFCHVCFSLLLRFIFHVNDSYI